MTKINPKPMKIEELRRKLRDLAHDDDSETAHGKADSLLIRYINDREVKKAYGEIEKWYA
jgi:hypothetical protein